MKDIVLTCREENPSSSKNCFKPLLDTLVSFLMLLRMGRGRSHCRLEWVLFLQEISMAPETFDRLRIFGVFAMMTLAAGSWEIVISASIRFC